MNGFGADPKGPDVFAADLDITIRESDGAYLPPGSHAGDMFMAPIFTDTKDPVIITDYEDGERLIVELPDTLANNTASAELSASGLDTEIKVGAQVIAILRGYSNIDALDAQFVLNPALSDASAAIETGDPGQILQDVPDAADITPAVGSIAAGADVVTVTDFDVAEDTLEIEANATLTYAPANDGADTTVLVDGIAVFLLQGISPAEMADVPVRVAP